MSTKKRPAAAGAKAGAAAKEEIGKASPVEEIKARGDYLRGAIAEGLRGNLSGAVAEDDAQLIKFHGIYQQDDRDRRAARAARKLEPAYSFMARLRAPGGLFSARQWLAMERIASEMTGTGALRLTSRQTLQLHGILKRDLKPVVQSYGRALLDSIAACGDVNRNVMCSPNPAQSPAHAAAYRIAAEISGKLLPASRAYFEIWLDEERAVGETAEPLYGKNYLPRKFKIAMAIPPRNDTDVFAHDIGYIAVVERGRLAGFNVAVGGGLGMTLGDERTYPRLGEVVGFCRAKQAAAVAWHIASIQRDYGRRDERKLARFKYTVERLGVGKIKAELESRLGYKLAPPRPFEFTEAGDALGWLRDGKGLWHLTLLVDNGRVADLPGRALKSALAEVAAIGKCEFRATANQNIILANIAAKDRARIESVLARRGVADMEPAAGLRKNAMACVALPTCPLAFAEAERYFPALLAKLQTLWDNCGLNGEEITIRMTGCPNNCARPTLAEIGFIGKSLGRYNIYLGAAANGTRLNKLYRENANEEQILAALSPLFADYAKNRKQGERFGDFTVRAGHIKATTAGNNFHAV